MRSSLLLAAALLLLLGQVQARPHRSGHRHHHRRQAQQHGGEKPKCASKCSGVGSKFRYVPGKSYKYAYSAETSVSLPGVEGSQSNTVRQSATATISVLSKCEMVLHLEDVSLTGGSEGGAWKSELESRPLRFSFDDGIIREICPSPEEPAWAANIKRGILSAFQNSLEGSGDSQRVLEADVSGLCPTDYTVESAGGVEKHSRRKNLIACSGHHGNYSAIRGVPYDMASKVQNIPLLDSDSNCEHEIQGQILQRATCTEQHSFSPMSGDSDEGILASTSQSLALQSTGEALPCCARAIPGPRQSITFDHSEYALEASTAAAAAARGDLRSLCQSSQGSVRPETPGHFVELVYNLRKMAQPELQSLEAETKSAPACPAQATFLKDAMSMCGSEACLGVMKAQLKRGEMSESEQTAWLASLGLVPRPTLGMVRVAEELMNTVPAKGLLGLSALVHGYCRVNPLCAEVPEVERFVQGLLAKLGNGCVGGGSEEEMSLALKAIGNVGHVRSALPKLVQCVENEQAATGVRVWAVQSLRRMPCSEELEQPLQRLMSSVEESVELRLTAFLGLLRCPRPQTVAAIVASLNDEPVNQVSSFIYSYLRAKQRSSSPVSTEIRRQLRRHSLHRRFGRDPLRFSNFMEFGSLMERYNLGAHLDEGFMFEPTSSLPRQAFANLTIHLFGTAVNLLEVGGRFEGMDVALSQLWGPAGYFSNPDAFYFQDSSSAAGPLHSRVQRFQDLWNQRRPKETAMSIQTYMRVFGDELAAWRYEDPNVVESVRGLMDTEKAFNFLENLAQMKLRKNILFLDSTLTVPTLGGVPLRLAVNGSATINVEVNTKASLKSLMRPPHSAELMGHIKPSAAVEVAASLALDTRGVKSGARMITRIHTATNVKGSLSLKDGTFSTKVELPDQKMDIVDVHSQLFSLNQNVATAEAGVPGPRSQGQKKCTPAALNRVAGVKLCGEVQAPGKTSKLPILPLSGPLRTRLTLEKDDATLSSYDFQAAFQTTPNRLARLSFNTPGSTVDRELMAQVELVPGSEIKGELKYPGKHIALTGTLSQADQVNTGRLALTVDQKDEYVMTANVRPEAGKGYKLDGEIVRPGQPTIKANGELSTAMPRLALVGKVEQLYDTPVEAKAIYEAEGKTYKGQLGLKSPALNFDLDDTTQFEGSYGGDFQLSSETRLSHKRPADANDHVATFTWSAKNKQAGDDYDMDASFATASNWYPHLDSALSLKSSAKPNLVENRISGKLLGDEAEMTQVTRTSEGDKFTTELLVRAPKHGMDHTAVIVYQNRFPERLEASAVLNTPRTKGIKGEVLMTKAPGNQLNMDMSAALEWPNRKISASHKLNQVAPKEYKSEANLQWGAGPSQKLSAMSTIKAEGGRKARQYQLDSAIDAMGKKVAIKKRLAINPRESHYQGSLKANGQSYYDFNLLVNKAEPKKSIITSHIRSQVAGVNFDVNGEIHAAGAHNNVKGTVKKDGQEWLKGELVYPMKLRGGKEKKAKASVQWALDGPQKKELTAEYRLEKAGKKERTHQLTARVSLAQGPAYDISLRVHKSNHYALNLTANRGQAQVLDFSTGIVKVGSYAQPSELTWDMEWTSNQPLPQRSYGLLLGQKNNGEGLSSSGFLEDRLQDSKLSYDIEYKRVGGKMVQYKLSLGSKTEKLRLTSDLDFADVYDLSSIAGGKTGLELEWSGKKASYNSDWKREGGIFTYKSDIATPFQAMSKANVEAELGGGKARLETRWNQDKRVEITLEGKAKPKKADLSARIATSFENMRNLEAGLKYAFKKEWEVDTWIGWGKAEKVRFYHTTKGPKYEVGFEGKVGAKDVKGKLASEWDAANGKYKAEAEYADAPNMWKVNGDVDTRAESGRFEVQTPTEALKSAAVTAKRTGDGEWLIESDRNGQANLLIRSTLKLKDGDHKMQLDVEKIAKPFSVTYEGKFTEQKWRLKAELTKDPAGSPVVYGLHLADEQKSDTDRLMDIRIRHPSRQLNAKISSHNSLPNKFTTTIELTPNAAANRGPTKLHLKYEKKSERLCEAEAKVEDPSLTQPIQAQLRLEKEGQCSGRGSACALNAHGSLTYSTNAEEVLTVQAAVARGPADPVQRRGGLVTPQEVRFSVQSAHPASGLHAKLFAQMEYERCGESVCRQEYEGGVEFKNAAKEVKQYSLNGAWDVYAPAATLKVRTPEMEFSLRAESGPEPGEWRLAIAQNGDEIYSVSARLSPEDKVAVFEVSGVRNGNTEVLLHASARLVNKDQATIRIWHTENGKRIEDGEITVRLDRADLLNTKFYLRPGLDREVQFAAQKAREQMAAGNGGDGLRQAWTAVQDSHGRLHSSVYGAAEPLLSHWSNQRNAFADEFGPAISATMDVLQLYWEIVRELSLTAMDIVEQTIDGIVDTMPSAKARQAYYQAKDALADIPGSFRALGAPFAQAARSIAETGAQAAQSLKAMKDQVAETLNAKAMQEQLKSLYEEVKDYPIVAQILEWVVKAQKELPAMGFSGVADSLKQAYNQAEGSASQTAEDVKKYLDGWEASLVEYELGRVVVALLKEAVESFQLTYNYVSPQDRIDDAFNWLRSQFHAYKKDKLSWNAWLPRLVKNVPEEGEYEVEIPLPVKAHSLEQLVDAFHPDSFTALGNSVSEGLSDAADAVSSAVGGVPAPANSDELQEKFRDVLHTVQGYQAAASLGRRSWPYASRALIVGDEHFVTFDGRAFQFKAHCEYLLAHDFVDQRFSIHALFEPINGKVGLKALKVRAEGHEVTLGRKGHVKVDGRPTELPWQKMDDLGSSVKLQVARGEHAAKVEAADGLRVKCNWYYDLCEISLPGHYHGKTSGLLGSNDNEASNDWTLPDGTLAADVNAFAKGWHVEGGNCAAATSLSPAAVPENAASVCEDYFAASGSPFAACFRSVNPKPFQTICAFETKDKSAEEAEKQACEVAAGYRQVCSWAHISLDMPANCIRCATPSGQLTESEDEEIPAAAGDSADVVFVVEESPCNAAAKGAVADAANAIVASLGQARVPNVRFGVVGFGGLGVHAQAHFHSGSGRLNFDQAGLNAAAATLDFTEELAGADGSDKAGAMAALKFTTDYYPFRPAVAKIVVLVTCGKCVSEGVGYYELQNALLNNGVQLHLLARMSVESEEGRMEGVAGLDADSLYGKNGAQKEGADRAAVVAPHDSCTILAQETRGSVFKLKASQALARVVAAKASAEPQCRVCECAAACSAQATPITRCYPCEVPEPVSLSGSSSSFFNIPYLSLRKPRGL